MRSSEIESVHGLISLKNGKQALSEEHTQKNRDVRSGGNKINHFIGVKNFVKLIAKEEIDNKCNRNHCPYYQQSVEE